nr:MAG TPA: Serine/threonine-protein phosphatase PGAM5, mitochondrial [Caudoviricetes sp.]
MRPPYSSAYATYRISSISRHGRSMTFGRWKTEWRRRERLSVILFTAPDEWRLTTDSIGV